MKQARTPRFDDLETRQLQTVAHAHPHIKSVPTGPALVLTGNLTVNNKLGSASDNGNGIYTASYPVTGVLGNVGKVTGFWVSALDGNGNDSGDETLQLHNKKGSFTISFNNMVAGTPQTLPTGMVMTQKSQQVTSGSGHYAHATESGQIALIGKSTKVNPSTLGIYTDHS